MRQWNLRVPDEMYRLLAGRASAEGLSLQELGRRVIEVGLKQPLPGSMRERVDDLENRLEALTDDLDRRLARLEGMAEGRY